MKLALRNWIEKKCRIGKETIVSFIRQLLLLLWINLIITIIVIIEIEIIVYNVHIYMMANPLLSLYFWRFSFRMLLLPPIVVVSLIRLFIVNWTIGCACVHFLILRKFIFPIPHAIYPDTLQMLHCWFIYFFISFFRSNLRPVRQIYDSHFNHHEFLFLLCIVSLELHITRHSHWLNNEVELHWPHLREIAWEKEHI